MRVFVFPLVRADSVNRSKSGSMRTWSTVLARLPLRTELSRDEGECRILI